MHVGAQLDQRLEAADVLRELVVQRGEDALLDVLDLHVERRGLPFQLLTWMLVGELGRHVDGRVDGLAGDPLFELRDDAARAELELHVVAPALLHLLAVDVEGEVDGDDVPLLRRARGLGRLEARVLLAEHLELLVDRVVRDVGGRTRELEALPRTSSISGETSKRAL